MILACRGLTYLDQRPVRVQDRECVEAWAEGGLAAERALRERWAREERDRMHAGVAAMRRMRDANLARRGIDASSDEAQLRAVQERGREIMRSVLGENRREGKATSAADESQLEPILRSIQIGIDFEQTEIGRKLMEAKQKEKEDDDEDDEDCCSSSYVLLDGHLSAASNTEASTTSAWEEAEVPSSSEIEVVEQPALIEISHSATETTAASDLEVIKSPVPDVAVEIAAGGDENDADADMDALYARLSEKVIKLTVNH